MAEDKYVSEIKRILKELVEGMNSPSASRHEKRKLHWQHEMVMRCWKAYEEVNA